MKASSMQRRDSDRSTTATVTGVLVYSQEQGSADEVEFILSTVVVLRVEVVGDEPDEDDPEDDEVDPVCVVGTVVIVVVVVVVLSVVTL